MVDGRLNGLLIPEEPIRNRELVASLSDYIRIVEGTDNYHFQSAYSGLEPRQKLIVVLLGEKTRRILGLIESETLDPVKISRISDVPLERAYPELRTLEQERVVENDGGEYRVPPDSFNEARYILEKGK